MAKKTIRIWVLAELYKVVEIDFDTLPQGYDEDDDTPKEVRESAHIMDAIGDLFGQGVDHDIRDYGYDEVDLEAEAKLEAEAQMERARLALNRDGTG